MSYSNIGLGASAVEPTQPHADAIRNLVADCLQYAGQTRDALDRALGGQPPGPAAAKPTSVPNGLFEHIQDELRVLRDVLGETASRSNRIA